MFRELKFGGAGSTRLKMPESEFDRAATAVLVGLAAIIATLFIPIHDFALEISGHKTVGQLIKTESVAKKGNRENVGVYEFADVLGSKLHATSKFGFKEKTKIPKTAIIAWKKGEPQNARVLYQGGFSLIALILGIILTLFGAYQLHKIRKKAD